MKVTVEKVKKVVTYPFKKLGELFDKIKFAIMTKFAEKMMGKSLGDVGQAATPGAGGQSYDGLKTMIMEFARKTYSGVSKDKMVVITMSGQFRVEDVQIDPEILNDPKQLRKSIKQAFDSLMQQVLGSLMGLTGGMPTIPGMPF